MDGEEHCSQPRMRDRESAAKRQDSSGFHKGEALAVRVAGDVRENRREGSDILSPHVVAIEVGGGGQSGESCSFRCNVVAGGEKGIYDTER